MDARARSGNAVILVDQNESRNQPELVALLRQSAEVQEGSFNQTAGSSIVYPDFSLFGGQKLIGINRKTVGEWLSSPDKVIEQIQRELAGPVEHLALIIEGVMVATHNGMTAYSIDWAKSRYWQSGFGGSVPFSARTFAINPKHAQNEQTRLEFLGVQVVHTYSTLDTATKIISFHELAMSGEPNRVLDKLQKQEIAVLALDPDETAMARMLMSVPGAKWGEELALTVAGLGYRTVGDLFRMWDSGGQLCDTMLRSGNRRVGNAAELRLQQALGFTPRSANPELQGQSRTEGALSST